MRQLVVVASLVGAFGLAAPTGAGERAWYMGLEGGVEWDGASGTDNGWAGFVTVGSGISSNVSLEAELGYRTTTADGFFSALDIDQTSLMINGVYEAPLSEAVSVAVGLGIGADQVSVDFGFGDDSEIEIATQLKLGLSIDVAENTELVANYRYMEMLTDSGINNSTLTIGVRFAL